MVTATIAPVTVPCRACGGTGYRDSGGHICDGGCCGMGTIRLDLDVDWLRNRVADLEEENRLLQLIVDTEPKR